MRVHLDDVQAFLATHPECGRAEIGQPISAYGEIYRRTQIVVERGFALPAYDGNEDRQAVFRPGTYQAAVAPRGGQGYMSWNIPVVGFLQDAEGRF